MPKALQKLNKKLALRQTILDEAKAIAATEGWQNVTIRKICQAINYTAPIVYQHFESKDKILQTIRYDAILQIRDQIALVYKNEKEPSKQLIKYGLSFWHFAIQESALYQIMFNLQGAICQDLEQETPVTKVQDYYKMSIHALNPHLNQSTKEVLLLIDHYNAIIHGFIALNMVKKIKSGNEEAERVFKQSLKHFVQSITKEESPAKQVKQTKKNKK